MRNIGDLSDNFDTSQVIQQSNMKNDCLHEVLRFVLPPTPHHEYKFGASIDRIIKMQYCYYPDYPEYLGVIEVNLVPHEQPFKFAYILIAGDCELRVARCDDKYYNSENTKIYNADYPYIILPKNYDKPIEWEYKFSNEIHVHCSSLLLTENIGENECDTLHVLRDITTRNISMTSVESYIAGFGLQGIDTEIDE